MINPDLNEPAIMMEFVFITHSEYSDIWEAGLSRIKKHACIEFSKKWILCNEINEQMSEMMENVKIKCGDLYENCDYNIEESYSRRLLGVLERVKQDFVLLWHDNNILVEDTDTYGFAKIMEFIGSNEVDQFRLHAGSSFLPGKHVKDDIYIMQSDDLFVYSVYPTIWKTSSLIALLEQFPQKTYREIEDDEVQNYIKQNYRSYYTWSSDPNICYPLGCGREIRPHIVKYMHMILRGQWTAFMCRKEIEKLAEEFAIDLSIRGIYQDDECKFRLNYPAYTLLKQTHNCSLPFEHDKVKAVRVASCRELEIKTLHEIPHKTNLYDKDENGREINIYKLQNVVLEGFNAYYPNVLLHSKEAGLFLPVMERTMSLGSEGSSYYERVCSMKWNCREPVGSVIMTEPIFFFVYNTDNYYHFLYDSLPYLITYFHLKKTVPQLKLLIQYPNEQKHTFYDFFWEFLEILGIGKADCFMVQSEMVFECVYVSSSYTHDFDSNLPPREEIYGFFREMVQTVNHINFIKGLSKSLMGFVLPKKIYVSRRTWIHGDFSNIGTNYTTRRVCENETELVEHLVGVHGYAEIFTENLTTMEKIMYFSGATHVAGLIGGGIVNVLFSPATTELMVLVSPGFLDVNSRFRWGLCRVGVQYNMSGVHIEQGLYKKYMRIKTKDGIVGEIVGVGEDCVELSYLEGSTSNTGWNLENQYTVIKINLHDIERVLDSGLNSSWKVVDF